MAKISIIGSGWLALPLANSLQDYDNQVLVTSTRNSKVKSLRNQGFTAVQYQLGEEADDQLFDCDVLIIAITSKDVDAFKKLMSQINPQRTQHIIYISSTSVYANDGQTHDENSTALNSESPLLAIEKLIQQHPKSTIIRFAGLVGPGRHPGRFFAKSGIINNSKAAINLIHLDDCIGIIEQVIAHKAWNEILNGCAENHPEKGAYYQQMARLAGRAVPELADNRQGSNKIISNKKVKRQLAYSFKYPDVFDFKFD